MVDIDISSTPLKVIGREVCSQARGLFGLSKDLGPKKIQTFEGKRSQKK